MATTNRIAQTVLAVGETATAGGTLTPGQETLCLEMVVAQITDSVARLVVRNSLGNVIASAVVTGSGTTRVFIDRIAAQQVNGWIECLQGSCRVRLDEITGIEATSGATTIDTNDIADASIATAKLAGGAVTPAKMGTFTAIKCLSAAGKNGKGAIALAGTAVGDRLIAAFGEPTAGGALAAVANDAATFEQTITVINEIQQTSGANLSGSTYVFLLAPAAS